MGIADAFATGPHKRNLGHFSSIVKMALIDNEITEGEAKFLRRKARSLNITDEEMENIIENPDLHPMNPPIGHDESIIRLYRITTMLYADDSPSKDEVAFLKRIIAGLSFRLEDVDKIASEAVHLIMNDNDEEDFAKAIKTVSSDLYE